MARNSLCQQFLQSPCKFLFMIDSDVIAPRDAVLRLMAHNQPVISGLYCRRSPPAGVPVAIKNGAWVMQYRQGEVMEVDMVGAGCLLIRRDLLEALPPSRPEAGKHWFDWKVDMGNKVPQGEAVSEDFAFCQAVRFKLGVKVLLDTNVVCRHIGNSESTYGQLQPCNATPHT